VFKGNNRGQVSGALAAIDVALWDLKAKSNGEPLWKTLGAASRRVRAYASDIGLNLSDDDLRRFYEGMAARGISAGKIKVGLDHEMDLRRIGLMRDALATSGKTPALMIDSNEYWSPKEAIRQIMDFERHFDLTWAEEPARRWDYRGLRQVSRSVRAAVATGENLNDISEYMALIANEAVDVVQVGVGTSGITGAMMTADLAYGFELPVSVMNCPANYMAHLAAALPNHNMMEALEAGADAGLVHGHTIEDGCIVLSDDPGLGLAFDPDKLKAWAIEQPTSRARMPFSRRRGAGLFVVGPREPAELPDES
jgi:L-alanine-DL-glutamate epimerase-like enolase superfamily enzyme